MPNKILIGIGLSVIGIGIGYWAGISAPNVEDGDTFFEAFYACADHVNTALGPFGTW